MKRPRPLVVLAIAAALTGLAVPAVAAPPPQTGDTEVTFTLSGGYLGLSVPTTAVLPGGNTGGGFVMGTLGSVVVTDQRGTQQPWTVQASTTGFVGPAGTPSVQVIFNGGLATAATGDFDVLQTKSTSLAGTPVTVLEASRVQGNNSVTYKPKLTIETPPNSLAGLYEGTITTSFL